MHGNSLPLKTCKNLDANTMIALFDGAATITLREMFASSDVFDRIYCVRSDTKNVVFPVPACRKEKESNDNKVKAFQGEYEPINMF